MVLEGSAHQLVRFHFPAWLIAATIPTNNWPPLFSEEPCLNLKRENRPCNLR